MHNHFTQLQKTNKINQEIHKNPYDPVPIKTAYLSTDRFRGKGYDDYEELKEKKSDMIK